MQININNFSNQIEKIKKYVKEYEIKIYETVSSMKNISFYWNDGYTSAFFRKIDEEIQFTGDLVNYLYRLLSLFTSIYLIYNSINRRKSMLLGYSGDIVNINDFVVSSSDDEKIAEIKRKLYESVINAENEISSLVSRIEVPYIRKMDFDNLYVEKSSHGFVGMLDGIDDELKRLEYEMESAINSSKVLKDNLYYIVGLYNSNNSGIINGVVDQLDEGLANLNYNLEMGTNYINNRKIAYKEMIAKILSEAKKMDID